MEVRTRIAPSPTGLWHIGNTRTALYNYLFARHNDGKFILRIEDTDRERYMPEAVESIKEALTWLGLNYDEGPDKDGRVGPYVQSARLEIYKKYAQELVEKGVAYEEEGAVRFKTTKEGQTTWHELIGGKNVTFENKTQEDFVILKSDGYPTYNFANVIDDHLMQITHVIRGQEFISSTPKHIMLYQAFGWELPQFGHVPLILGTDRSKLSKRHGAKPALEFQTDGYLPEAIINYMALLGWTPPSGKEILSIEEMIKEFDIEDVNVASPIFDIQKLDWMNGEYIRKTQNSNLKTQIWDYLMQISGGALAKGGHPTEDEIEKVIPLVKERIKKLSDFVPLTDFLWEKPEYDLEEFKKARIENQKVILEKISETLESLSKPWDAANFEQTFRKLADDLGIKAGDIFQLIRVAVSGQSVTPPLFESIQILGEEETINRVKEALKFIQTGTQVA